MNSFGILDLFQGISTLMQADTTVLIARLSLIALGALFVFLGKKGTLEPLLMIPMGLGMIASNAGVLFLDPETARHAASAITGGAATGTMIVAPLVSQPDSLIYMLQVDFLQPLYSFMFSNGLIACLVFMGIGVLLDVGFILERPMESMFLALCAELGTFLTFPIAVAFGLNWGESASIAMVGGADGPMVLVTSLTLAKHMFVPISVVAYLYLALTYGGYPYLIKLLVPKRLRAVKTERMKVRKVKPEAKIAFAVIGCALLSFLFPAAAPLFLSLFVGVAVKEAKIKPFIDLLGGPVLYGSTFILGLMLGVLCEAGTILNPKVLLLLVLGVVALLVSGIGGIVGGYALYFLHKGKYNPVIGIAAVSCVPTTAKVAQKIISEEAKGEIILPQALGANICGVITSAVICGIYITVIPLIMGH